MAATGQTGFMAAAMGRACTNRATGHKRNFHFLPQTH
jgi:hypothetical protein